MSLRNVVLKKSCNEEEHGLFVPLEGVGDLKVSVPVGKLTHTILINDRPCWIRISKVRVLGVYHPYNKDEGGLTFTVTENAGSLLVSFEEAVKRAFLGADGEQIAGSVLLTPRIMDRIFRPVVDEGLCITVSADPGCVDVFAEDRRKIQSDVGRLALDGWECNIVVQPCWLYVSKDSAKVHWRLRQLRGLRHPSRSALDEVDSDWSL
jgi:hypothetical protein